VPFPSEPDAPVVQAFAVNEYFRLPERPPKFQHGWAAWPIALFLLTVATTSFAGFSLTFSLSGLWYAVAILLILGAHEFGHYFACRWHNVDCTLPYFIPAPLFMTGTLGAVIKIREPFPSRAALFDIGVAGPIAGFVTLLPFLIGGIMWSEVSTLPEDVSGILFMGEPPLFKYLAGLVHGPVPEGADITVHPMGFAAWFGMLATALNLMPFGQLDGGHIAYAVLGRRATAFSAITLAVVIGLAVVSLSWIAMAVMLTVMTFVVGLRHPAPYDDETPLSAGRLIVAGIAVLIFIGCFTPVPLTINWE
jgi:membrane-associated protease RseP (regulator of RpoE activity)